MNCQQAIDNLLDFVEGTLSPELRLAVERHVGSCQLCPALVESYRKTSVLCRKVMTRSAPPDVVDRLLSVLRDKTRSQ